MLSWNDLVLLADANITDNSTKMKLHFGVTHFSPVRSRLSIYLYHSLCDFSRGERGNIYYNMPMIKKQFCTKKNRFHGAPSRRNVQLIYISHPWCSVELVFQQNIKGKLSSIMYLFLYFLQKLWNILHIYFNLKTWNSDNKKNLEILAQKPNLLMLRVIPLTQIRNLTLYVKNWFLVCWYIILKCLLIHVVVLQNNIHFRRMSTFGGIPLLQGSRWCGMIFF